MSSVPDWFGNSHDIVLSHNGKYAFVANDWRGLVVIDLDAENNYSNPSKLASISGWNQIANSLALTPDGNYLVVSISYEGLWIIDVSDPGDP